MIALLLTFLRTALVPFLRTNWRPLAWALGAVLLLTTAYQGWQLYQRHRLAKHIEAAVASHATRTATEPARAHHFDSLVYNLAGQAREARRQATISQKSYDSLRRLFPAAYELPAQPARYRPAD